MGERATAASDGLGAASVVGRLAPMIYGPTLLFSIGEGAVLPLLPVLATRLGADVATAALVGTMLVVGELIGSIPAGVAVTRIGERWSMAIAAAVAFVGVLLMAWSPGVPVLLASALLVGLSSATFGVARLAFMTLRVPFSFRARSLSLLGGTGRLGLFLGPFIAAGLLALTGSDTATLWLFAALLVGVVLLVLLGPDPEHAAPVQVVPAASGPVVPVAPVAPADGTGSPARAGSRPGVWRTTWHFRDVLSRLGLAAAALSAVRSARQIVLPLWGVSLGMDAGSIALVVGVSGAVDFALFYASGQVMDRFGRLWATLPACLLMGVGFLALALTHDVSGAPRWFLALGIVLGLGNGLSSGSLMTLGADLAPREDPAPFLGSWRTLQTAGGALTPAMVSAVTALGSISLAVGLVGVIGLAGAVGFRRWIPRFVPPPARAGRATRDRE